MKIAILHSDFDQLGGAEKVALILAKHLKADILTTNFNQNKINEFGFSGVNIVSIGNVPKRWPQKQFNTISLFKNINLNKYNLIIINSEWALSASSSDIPTIWYVNSLPRDPFYENQSIYSLPIKTINKIFKNQVINNLKKLNITISNSNNTQRELVKNFKHDSILVYPPIDTSKYYFEEYGDFWLSVNRIDYYKRIELQLKAFSLLPDENLVIVGGDNRSSSGKSYFADLKASAPSNVKFLGDVYGNDLNKLYAKCRGLIATAKNEYFGLSPIEAMASGKPVVIVKDGGGLKEIADETTGFIVNPQDYKIAEAIKKISNKPDKYKDNCIKKAKKLSINKFTNHIDKIIKPFS